MMTIKLDSVDAAITRVLCERRGIDANRLFSDMLKTEASLEFVLQMKRREIQLDETQTA